MNPRIAKKIIFSIVTITILLMGLELGLKVLGFQFRYEEARGLPDWVRFNMNRWFLEYDPLLLWRVRRPNPDFNINSQGFRRHDEISLEKDVFEFRILCLGDSCTWGHGLGVDETYCCLLEKKLNQGVSGPLKYSVINAGVPGYSSYQGLIYLKERLLKYKPDLITVYFGRNDSRKLPDQWAGKPDSSHIKPAGTLQKILQLTGRSAVYQLVSACIYQIRKLTGSLPPPPASAPAGTNERNLPDRLKRVSSLEYRSNIREICRLGKASGARLLLMTSPVYPETTGNYNEELRNVAVESAEIILDLESVFQALGTRRLLLDDCHPTVEGNQVICREIMNIIPSFLVENL